MNKPDSPPPNAIAYSPEGAATVTGRSRSRIFKAIKDKELTARCRHGGCRRQLDARR
jgi:hypothetical protein